MMYVEKAARTKSNIKGINVPPMQSLIRAIKQQKSSEISLYNSSSYYINKYNSFLQASSSQRPVDFQTSVGQRGGTSNTFTQSHNLMGVI